MCLCGGRLDPRLRCACGRTYRRNGKAGLTQAANAKKRSP
jgi:hypothetical protein